MRKLFGKPNGVVSYLWDAPTMERKDANSKAAHRRKKQPTEFDLS